jgi:hypothetical protein
MSPPRETDVKALTSAVATRCTEIDDDWRLAARADPMPGGALRRVAEAADAANLGYPRRPT